jgi:cytochrome c-type biogenesis protein CcmH/NrfG
MRALWILFLIFNVLIFWISERYSVLKRFLITGLCSITVILIYFKYGNPDLKDYPNALLKKNHYVYSKLAQEQRKLQNYLRKHPKDCKAWNLLAESYRIQGQHSVARHLKLWLRYACESEQK